MSSFSAELLIAGEAFPLTNCTFGTQQATYERGRISAKVRYEPVHLTLDVPAGDILFAWANEPLKCQAVTILFRNANGGQAIETLRMAGAYCVGYQEVFAAGDAQGGAYQAVVILTDPAGWVLAAGGPASAYVAPAPGSHGLPTELVAREVAGQVAAVAPFIIDAQGVPRLPLITGDPPFTVKGASKGKPALDRAEFTRQLLGQEQGLNQLSVATFIANRDHYDYLRQLNGHGRDPKGDAAQKVARENALRDKIEELQLADEDLSLADAQAQAKKWLKDYAALHNPDQIAGGDPTHIAGMGNARVNSSIGAQWAQQNRIDGIDRQVRAYATNLTPEQQKTTFLNIKLPIA